MKSLINEHFDFSGNNFDNKKHCIKILEHIDHLVDTQIQSIHSPSVSHADLIRNNHFLKITCQQAFDKIDSLLKDL